MSSSRQRATSVVSKQIKKLEYDDTEEESVGQGMKFEKLGCSDKNFA